MGRVVLSKALIQLSADKMWHCAPSLLVGLMMISKRAYTKGPLPGLLLPVPLSLQQDFVYALQEWSLFSSVLWKCCNQILVTFKVRFPGDSQVLFSRDPQAGNPANEAQNLHNSGRTSLVLLFSTLWVTHLVGMGFDFIMIVPLLKSCCSFVFVFWCGYLFWWVPVSSCRWLFNS